MTPQGHIDAAEADLHRLKERMTTVPNTNATVTNITAIIMAELRIAELQLMERTHR